MFCSLVLLASEHFWRTLAMFESRGCAAALYSEQALNTKTKCIARPPMSQIGIAHDIEKGTTANGMARQQKKSQTPSTLREIPFTATTIALQASNKQTSA